MNISQMVWVGRHEGLLRDVARGCAYGDPTSLKQGAWILSAFLPDNCTIVPMPSHIGYPTTMYDLCRWIKYVKNRNAGIKGVVIWDGLFCDPHESSHITKLRNGVVPDIFMCLKHKPPEGRVFIIDNTICTGSTAAAALKVLPNATVLAITKG